MALMIELSLQGSWIVSPVFYQKQVEKPWEPAT